MYAFLFFGETFVDANFDLKLPPPVLDKDIQSFLGQLAGRGPKWDKVCIFHVLCMVVPGGDALVVLVCVLGPLGCVLDVGGGGEGGHFSFLPFCHALFLGGYHWFCAACGAWLREVGRAVVVSVV